jgi:hypothetical protein
MPRDYIPASDAQFNLWLHNFASQLNSSGTALGFSAGELSSLDEAVNLWDTQFAARLSARDAARSATALKRDARRAAIELVRPFARRVQAHPTTDDGVRAMMGLTPLEQPPIGSEGAGPANETPLLALDFPGAGLRHARADHGALRPEPRQREPQPAAARRDRRGASGARGRDRGRRRVALARQPLEQPVRARRAAVGGDDARVPLRVPVPPRAEGPVERPGRGGGHAVAFL